MEQKPNFSIANIVVSTELNALIDINSVFVYLPIKKEKSITNISKNEQKNQSKTKRENKRIKFIGQNNCFVSVRYNDKSRGIRLHHNKKGNITAFADADLQMFNKNFHMKISKNKINLMGVQNFDHIRQIFTFMITTFEAMQKTIKRKKDPNVLYKIRPEFIPAEEPETPGNRETRKEIPPLEYFEPSINNVIINFNILDSIFVGDDTPAIAPPKSIVLKDLTHKLHEYKTLHSLDYSLHFHNEKGKNIQMAFFDVNPYKKYIFTIKPNCKVNITTNGNFEDITEKYVQVKKILQHVILQS